MAKAYERTELEARTEQLRAAGWSISADGLGIEKVYRFAGFVPAMGFMALVAPVAEAADHHPEWRNVYNRVEVRLTTHEAGGATEKDVALAGHMERIAGMFATGA